MNFHEFLHTCRKLTSWTIPEQCKCEQASNDALADMMVLTYQ